MSKLTGFQGRNFMSNFEIDVSEDLKTVLKLSITPGAYFPNALQEAIEAASRLGGLVENNSVQFEFNDVTVIVQADSRSDHIYRDWQRALYGCIEGPVGPHPKATLTSEEIANDERIRAEKARESQQRHSAWLADKMAEIKYLNPPEPGTMFRYAPMRGVDLITPKHFDHLPYGTVLTSFNGARKAKGVDYIDDDTRGGFLAYGFPTQSEDRLVYEGPYRTE